MYISHHASSLHCIQIPTCVFIFDQSLSLLLQWSPWYWGSFLAGNACNSPGQQIMMHGWSFGLGKFPWKALLLWYFCWLLFDWGWKETAQSFLMPTTSPLHHLWEPHCLLPSPAICSSPSSSTLFLTLPPKLYSVFLVGWVCLLLLFLSIHFVECCLTWAEEKGTTSWLSCSICIKLGLWSCQHGTNVLHGCWISW